MEYKEITGAIIGASYRVYNRMGFGFLESVYEKCLLIELEKLGLKAQSQQSIVVTYDDRIVGEFVADILVNDIIIVELKSTRKLVNAHEIQLVNYLVATGKPLGLLLNFSPNGVEVKRKVKSLNFVEDNQL